MFELNFGDFGFTKHGKRTTECGICGFFAFCWAFLWLATLIFCVAWLFVCGVGFLRDGFCETDGSTLACLFGLFACLFRRLLGFLPAFSLNKKATAWLLPYPVILKIQSVDISLTLNMTM